MNTNSILYKIRTEIKNDREKIQGRSAREKLEYFVMYYKVPALLFAAVLAIAVSLVYSRAQYREYIFHAFLVNAVHTGNDAELSREFGEMIGADLEKNALEVDSSLYIGGNSQASISSVEKFAANVNTGTADVCIMPRDLFLEYAGEGCFGDLRKWLTKEQMAEYGERLVYQGDVPVGVEVNGFSKIQGGGLYAEDAEPVFGIVFNTEHGEGGSAFLEFLNVE